MEARPLLTLYGKVTKVEEKPWKDSPDNRVSKYVHVTDALGTKMRIEFQYDIDTATMQAEVGHVITGPVRKFLNERKAGGWSENWVLMTYERVEPSRAVQAA